MNHETLILRIVKSNDEIKAYISSDYAGNFITMEKYYGLVGDFDIRFEITANDLITYKL